MVSHRYFSEQFWQVAGSFRLAGVGLTSISVLALMFALGSAALADESKASAEVKSTEKPTEKPTEKSTEKSAEKSGDTKSGAEASKKTDAEDAKASDKSKAEKAAADKSSATHADDGHANHGHGEHGHGEHGHDDHGKEGVPGLIPQADLALWSLVVFCLLLFVVQKAGWQAISTGLNERERKIRQDIADAESNRVKSLAMLAEHEKRLAGVEETVKEILAEARRDAEHAKTEIIAVAQKEADASRQRAVADIERSRDQALVELFDYVSRGVLGATEKVISKSLTSDEQQKLVSDALNEMNLRQG